MKTLQTRRMALHGYVPSVHMLVHMKIQFKFAHCFISRSIQCQLDASHSMEMYSTSMIEITDGSFFGLEISCSVCIHAARIIINFLFTLQSNIKVMGSDQKEHT